MKVLIRLDLSKFSMSVLWEMWRMRVLSEEAYTTEAKERGYSEIDIYREVKKMKHMKRGVA